MIDLHAVAQASRASQDKGELEELLGIVREIRPEVIVEIGTWHGYSAEVWIKAFQPKLLISIEKELDCPFYGLEDPGETTAIYVTGADSTTDETALNTTKALQGKLVDFLFIDGSHLYEDVKRDFELYSPLVRRGGVVAFHDVRITDNPTVDVYKLWSEIKGNYWNREILSLAGTGTGVLWL